MRLIDWSASKKKYYKDDEVVINTNHVESNLTKKYSFTLFLFVIGLVVVSLTKNKTRNLQKELDSLNASINIINYDLNQSILDNEAITSPDNISFLAKENLNINFVNYTSSQIKILNDEKVLNEKFKKEEKNTVTSKISKEISFKIQKSKTELRKLQNLYNNPEMIPDEVKTKIVKEIDQKKKEIKEIYENPKDVLTLERMQKWGAVQVVKVFLGIPVVPGR